MRSRLWLAFTVVLLAIPAWAAEPPAKPEASAISVLEQNARDFERDTALGAPLSVRPGTDAELKQLQALASSGLKAAEEAVAKYPDNAQAHYLLGSWLLYGYRVKEVRQVVVTGDTAASGSSTQVVQGLEDGVDRGLAALRKATDLEPDNARYAIDYGAALFDCDRLSEAMGYLKSVWGGKLELTSAEKLEIALLLSRICETQAQAEEAREWVYSGLAANPHNAAVVQHLRWLDKALPEAEKVAAAEAAAEEAAGIEQVKQGESRVLNGDMLAECRFGIEVGQPLKAVAIGGYRPSWGLDLVAVPGSGGRSLTVARAFVGEWTLAGLAGEPLRMSLARESGSARSISMGNILGEAGSGVDTDMASRTREGSTIPLWDDQPFEIWKGETLVAQFANTADFQRAISGQNAEEPAQ